MYSKEDMLSSIQEAAEILGRSPTVSEYDELNLSPSSGHIRQQLGGWNNAKQKAGVGLHEPGRFVDDVPEIINMSQNEWESISAHYRSSLRKRVKYSEYKIDIGCQKCGFDEHPAALDFHHLQNKEENISVMIMNNRRDADIQREIDKCVVLCSNCHRQETDETFSL